MWPTTGHIDTIPCSGQVPRGRWSDSEQAERSTTSSIWINPGGSRIPSTSSDGDPYRMVGLERESGQEEVVRLPSGEFKLRDEVRQSHQSRSVRVRGLFLHSQWSIDT